MRHEVVEVDHGPRLDVEAIAARWLGTLAPSTRRGYSADVRSWVSYCAEAGLDPRAASGRDLTAWLDGLVHLKPSTRARRLSAVTSLYAWLKDEGLVSHVPEVPRTSRPRVRGQDDARLIGLDRTSAARLVRSADDHSLRMSALVAVGLTTGLRIEELLSLTPARLRTDGGGRVLATVTGKRDRTRTVVVPPLAAERLLAIEPEDACELYFRTRTGRAWSQREARDALARLGRGAGVPGLHPHLLRHTAASLALASGASMEAVRAMLGHSSLATTQRYVRAAGALDASPAYVLAAALSNADAAKSSRG